MVVGTRGSSSQNNSKNNISPARRRPRSLATLTVEPLGVATSAESNNYQPRSSSEARNTRPPAPKVVGIKSNNSRSTPCVDQGDEKEKGKSSTAFQKQARVALCMPHGRPPELACSATSQHSEPSCVEKRPPRRQASKKPMIIGERSMLTRWANSLF